MADHQAGADFSVRFWGVRGSIACGGPETARYGGNTSALEIRCGGRILLFDGGTGIRPCGKALMAEAPLDFDIFLTHTHFDHICGLPFFVPFFDKRSVVRLHAGHLRPEHTVHSIMCQLMQSPLFPVPPSIFPAQISFVDFDPGDVIRPAPGIAVRTKAINHPDRAIAYRVDYGGRSIAYVTDIEHPADGPDPELAAFLKGVDILIYDSMFSDAEYATRIGWGHSTWTAGCRLADLAAVKRFVAFHHDPDHDDAFMDRVAAEIDALRPGSVVAREGLVLTP